MEHQVSGSATRRQGGDHASRRRVDQQVSGGVVRDDIQSEIHYFNTRLVGTTQHHFMNVRAFAFIYRRRVVVNDLGWGL